MGYKRKARVLFLVSTNQYAALAVACAGELAADWLEAHACRPADASQELLGWADLAVTLDEGAAKACPPLPRHIQKKHYPLPAHACFEEIEQALRARIASIVGGMRIMEKG